MGLIHIAQVLPPVHPGRFSLTVLPFLVNWYYDSLLTCTPLFVYLLSTTHKHFLDFLGPHNSFFLQLTLCPHPHPPNHSLSLLAILPEHPPTHPLSGIHSALTHTCSLLSCLSSCRSGLIEPVSCFIDLMLKSRLPILIPPASLALTGSHLSRTLSHPSFRSLLLFIVSLSLSLSLNSTVLYCVASFENLSNPPPQLLHSLGSEHDCVPQIKNASSIYDRMSVDS